MKRSQNRLLCISFVEFVRIVVLESRNSLISILRPLFYIYSHLFNSKNVLDACQYFAEKVTCAWDALTLVSWMLMELSPMPYFCFLMPPIGPLPCSDATRIFLKHHLDTIQTVERVQSITWWSACRLEFYQSYRQWRRRWRWVLRWTGQRRSNSSPTAWARWCGWGCWLDLVGPNQTQGYIRKSKFLLMYNWFFKNFFVIYIPFLEIFKKELHFF